MRLPVMRALVCLGTLAATGTGGGASRRVDQWKAPGNQERLLIQWADAELVSGDAAPPWPFLLYVVGAESKDRDRIESEIFTETEFVLAARLCRLVRITPTKAVDLPYLRQIEKFSDPMLVVVDRDRKVRGVLADKRRLKSSACVELMAEAVDAAYETTLRDYVKGYGEILEATERLWRLEKKIAEGGTDADLAAQRKEFETQKRDLAWQEALLQSEATLRGAADGDTDTDERGLTDAEKAACRTYRERGRTGDPVADAFALEALQGRDSAAMAQVVLRESRRSSWSTWRAGLLLGQMRSEGARGVLRDALEKGARSERSAALRALAEFGDPGSVPSLVALAHGRSAAVREAAVDALGAQAGDEALDCLSGALEDDDPGVRVAAVRGLGQRGASAPLFALARRLADADWCVRKAAVLALGRLHASQAIPPLLDFLAAEEGALREPCLEALVRTTGQAIGFDAAAWRAWWNVAAAGFKLGPEMGEQTARELIAEICAAGPSPYPVTHHGIGTCSQNIVFLVDVSASTGGKMELPPDATPEMREALWSGTKLELMKGELERTLGELPKDARFNLLSFAGDVDAWHDRLFLATYRRGALKFLGDLKTVAPATGAGKSATRATAQPGGPGIRSSRVALAASSGEEHLRNTAGAILGAFGLFGPDPLMDRSRPEADTAYLVVDGPPGTGELRQMSRLVELVRELNRSRGVVIHVVAFDEPTRHHYLALAESTGGIARVHGG